MSRGKRAGAATRQRSNKTNKKIQDKRNAREVYRSEAGRSGKVACKRATKSPVLAAGAMGLVRRPGMGSNLVPVREAYRSRTLTGEQHGRGPSAFAPLRNVTSATREAFIGPVQRDW